MKKNLPTYCVGIDGCRDGWITVYAPVSSFDKAKAQHYQTLSQLKNDFDANSIFIIDMPIGLEVNKANRSCDIEARKFLGHRRSTIFSPPCRDAINSGTYQEAKAINLKKTNKSISKQSWFLTKKILETQKFVDEDSGIDLKEGHPECSFAEYAGIPIAESKKKIHGIFKRLEILKELNFSMTKLVEMLPSCAKIEIDDLFDAAILCWTANRVFYGENKTFPRLKHQNKDAKNEPFITF